MSMIVTLMRHCFRTCWHMYRYEFYLMMSVDRKKKVTCQEIQNYCKHTVHDPSSWHDIQIYYTSHYVVLTDTAYLLVLSFSVSQPLLFHPHCSVSFKQPCVLMKTPPQWCLQWFPVSKSSHFAPGWKDRETWFNKATMGTKCALLIW